MLLLRIMSILFPQRVRALYINHQLQSQNAAWGEFVQHVCQQEQIPCTVQVVDVEQGNLEQQAREARYAAFQQHCQSNEILVLAHHQQDQAETLLLRLLSGAGVQGLSAMKMLDQRDCCTIWRPLLALSRAQIESWSAQLNLSSIEDPTNQDCHYDRAWSRQVLWPVLTARFPQMQQALARTTLLMQDAHDILSEVLTQDWSICIEQERLDIHAWRQLSVPRQRQLISAWMKGDEQYRPALHTVQRLIDEVIDARPDAQALLKCQNFYYVRYQDYIYRLTEQAYHPATESPRSLPFLLEQTFEISGIHYRIDVAPRGLSHQLLGKRLDLQPRQGGEKIHFVGRVGKWPLKKAIQEAQIFPWQRHAIQILSIDNVMLGVFTPQGFWLAQSVYVETDGWLPQVIL